MIGRSNLVTVIEPILSNRLDLEGIVHTAPGHADECWELNACKACQFHIEGCPCLMCGWYWQRDGLTQADWQQHLADVEQEEQEEAARLLAFRQGVRKTYLNAFSQFTRPIEARNAAEALPSMLDRADGETLLYAGKLNSIFGEPGTGKSWVALMAAIEALSRGGSVLWWDFEDKPDTLFTRAAQLGALDLIQSDNMKWVMPDLNAEDDTLIAAAEWLARGGPHSLLVIDAAESAGCPSDGSAVTEWFNKNITPFTNQGIGVLLLDHVPKKREDRPRGAIGSQHKLARIDGAAIAISGKPWTKKHDGKIFLKLHKDRQGDLPAVNGGTLAVIVGEYDQSGAFGYVLEAPERQDNNALNDRLLEAIHSHGGVRGQRALRALLGGKAAFVDGAAEELIYQGLLTKSPAGKAWRYDVTENGAKHLADVA